MVELEKRPLLLLQLDGCLGRLLSEDYGLRRNCMMSKLLLQDIAKGKISVQYMRNSQTCGALSC